MRPRFRELTIICSVEEHPKHRAMVDFNKVTHIVRFDGDSTEVHLATGITLLVTENYEMLVRYLNNQSASR